MKNNLLIFLACLALTSCTKELKFEQKKYEKKTQNDAKNGAQVSIDIPVGITESVEADSINKAVFAAAKEIIYVGEKPFEADDYSALMNSFIESYTTFKKENSYEIGWSAEIKGSMIYTADAILNIELNHYSFTEIGRAHV